MDAVAASSARLPEEERATYLEHYGRCGGDPPRLLDAHPNPLAHSIIAEAIVEAIERERGGQGR